MARPLTIDAHMHIYGSREEGRRNKTTYNIWEYGEKPDVRFSKYDGDLEDALQAMAECSIDRAVAVNLFSVGRTRAHALAALPADLDDAARGRALAEVDATTGDRLREYNLWLCDIARRHPQIIPFVAVDPWALGPEELATHLREMVTNHGAKGFKIHPVLQRFEAGDERMWPVYRACEEMGVAIITHSGPAKEGPQYAEPRAFAPVLRAFPNLTIVLAHMGGGAWRQLPEIAGAHPNAYFDCCEIMEWTGGSTAPTREELAALIRDVGPGRVLMGSDFPWYDLDRSVQLVMEFPYLAQGEKEAILGENAARILKL